MLSKSTIKYIQSLQQKKFRDETGCFVAEGPKLVSELLMSGRFTCSSVYATSQWVNEMQTDVRNMLEGRLSIIEDFELEKIAASITPNRVVAVFEKRDPEPLTDPRGLTLVLDDIRDPGNMGTIIRTADWFGVDQIICSEGCVDMYNPKVVQSTMASLGQVNIMYTPLERWMLEHRDVPSYAAVLTGQDIRKIPSFSSDLMLVIGNESAGISKGVMDICSHTLTIPRTGMAESLNAAVATGILLYAITGK